MIVYPALDLREGRVVQLVGGRLEHERVSLPDPPAVARRWLDTGFSRLHVVDLDAALERGDNRNEIRAVRSVVLERRRTTTTASNDTGPGDDTGTGNDADRGNDGGGRYARSPGDGIDPGTGVGSEGVPASEPTPLLQVGGGIRDGAGADALLASGVDRIIVGTRAVVDPAWLETLARRHPGRIVVAADVKGEEVVARGWTEASGRRLDELLKALEPAPLAGILITDVGREGRMAGVDAARFERASRQTRHAVLAAGGIGSRDDIDELARTGVSGAVIGMALYTGAVDADALAREYGS